MDNSVIGLVIMINIINKSGNTTVVEFETLSDGQWKTSRSVQVPSNSVIPFSITQDLLGGRIVGANTISMDELVIARTKTGVILDDIIITDNGTLSVPSQSKLQELQEKEKEYSRYKRSMDGSYHNKGFPTTLSKEELEMFEYIQLGRTGYFGNGHSLKKAQKQYNALTQETALAKIRREKISGPALERIGISGEANIALVFSGGGMSTVLNTVGTLDALKTAGLLDTFAYIAGASDSALALQSLYTSKSSPFHYRTFYSPQPNPWESGQTLTKEHLEHEGTKNIIPKANSMVTWIGQSTKAVLNYAYDSMLSGQLYLGSLLQEFLAGKFCSSEYPRGAWRDLPFARSEQVERASEKGLMPYLITVGAVSAPNGGFYSVEYTFDVISVIGEGTAWPLYDVGSSSQIKTNERWSKVFSLGEAMSYVFAGMETELDSTVNELSEKSKLLADFLKKTVEKKLHDTPINQIVRKVPNFMSDDKERPFVEVRDASVISNVPIASFCAGRKRNTDVSAMLIVDDSETALTEIIRNIESGTLRWNNDQVWDNEKETWVSKTLDQLKIMTVDPGELLVLRPTGEPIIFYIWLENDYTSSHIFDDAKSVNNVRQEAFNTIIRNTDKIKEMYLRTLPPYDGNSILIEKIVEKPIVKEATPVEKPVVKQATPVEPAIKKVAATQPITPPLIVQHAHTIQSVTPSRVITDSGKKPILFYGAETIQSAITEFAGRYIATNPALAAKWFSYNLVFSRNLRDEMNRFTTETLSSYPEVLVVVGQYKNAGSEHCFNTKGSQEDTSIEYDLCPTIDRYNRKAKETGRPPIKSLILLLTNSPEDFNMAEFIGKQLKQGHVQIISTKSPRVTDDNIKVFCSSFVMDMINEQSFSQCFKRAKTSIEAECSGGVAGDVDKGFDFFQ